MTEADLKRRVWRHNALQIATGTAATLWAVVMWPISFWLMRFLASKPFELADVKVGWDIGFYLALVGLALLALEGVRYWRLIVADREDGGESDFADILGLSPGGGALYYNVGGAHILVHLMLSAPRMTAQAICVPRRLIRTTSAAYIQGAAVYNRLAEERKWMPLSEWSNCRAGVFLLDRLRLIWTRLENGETQLRIPPGSDRTAA